MENKKSPVVDRGLLYQKMPACFLYRNGHRDRPVFQGFRMSMMMQVGESDVHIGWQYIHINGI